MKVRTSILMIAILYLGCVVAPVQAQSDASASHSTDPDVKRALAAIRILEAVDQDPATPPGVKERNRATLQARREQLRTLIKSKMYDLQQYEAKLKQNPSDFDREIKEIGEEISNLKKDLDLIAQDTTVAKRQAEPAAELNTVRNEAVEAPERTKEVASEGGTAAAHAGETTAAQTLAATGAVTTTAAGTGGTGGAGGSSPGSATATPSAASAQAATVPDECTGIQSDPKAFSIADRYRCQLVSQILEAKARNPQARWSIARSAFPLTLIIIARKDRPTYLAEAEEKRTDKQLGAGPSSTGSTSLTVKGSGPQILGLAVENGALTQTRSGTTLTFRGNPLGIAQALADKGYVQSYDEAQKYALTRILKNLSFHFSFDASRGNPDTTAGGGSTEDVFTADKQQLSEFGIRYEIFNQRDPRSKRYQAEWERFMDSAANRDFALKADALRRVMIEPGARGSIAFGPAVVTLAAGTRLVGREIVQNGANVCVTQTSASGHSTATFLPNTPGTVTSGSTVNNCGVVTDFVPPTATANTFKDPVLQAWYEKTDVALEAAGRDKAKIEEVLKTQLDQLPIDQLSADLLTAMRNLSVGFEAYLKIKKDIVDKINQGGIITFEYTNKRNVNAPNLSNFTLIAEKGAGGTFDGTFNGSVTIFDKIPMGLTRRIRDYQFSGQLDVILGKVAEAGNLVLFFSGRYERLMDDAISPDGMMTLDTKGPIGVFQTGIKIPVKGTGFKIPVSFTYATRTELIKEKEVRGNIGFTFDLDSLFARFKP